MNTGVVGQILWRYAALEREVQNLISASCAHVCGVCPTPCCRVDLCEEAFRSPFLRALHGQEPDSVQFSERYGWRTENGCWLSLGRPPVCYDFFCDEILNSQRSAAHRYVLQVLGKLLQFTGDRALGDRHLVEIDRVDDLARIPVAAFKERMNAARSALEHIRFFHEHGFFDADAMEQLGPIVTPPESL